jgi:hypothetical protein
MTLEHAEVRERYVILLLGVVDRPVPSIWHVEKELFILSQSNPIVQGVFNFEKHYNGPYSQVLKEVVEEPISFENAYKFDERGYYLTDTGKRIFKQIVKEYKNDERFVQLINALKMIRNLYDKLSNDELLFLIYITYPAYIKYSNISDKLLRDKNKRKQLASDLLRKGLITEIRYNELLEANYD